LARTCCSRQRKKNEKKSKRKTPEAECTRLRREYESGLQGKAITRKGGKWKSDWGGLSSGKEGSTHSVAAVSSSHGL